MHGPFTMTHSPEPRPGDEGASVSAACSPEALQPLSVAMGRGPGSLTMLDPFTKNLAKTSVLLPAERVHRPTHTGQVNPRSDDLGHGFKKSAVLPAARFHKAKRLPLYSGRATLKQVGRCVLPVSQQQARLGSAASAPGPSCDRQAAYAPTTA